MTASSFSPDKHWTAHTRADGSRIEFRHDRAGRKIATVDPLGRETHIERHENGLVIGHVTPDGQRWDIERDALGDTVSIEGPESQHWQITRNERGQPVEVTGPTGTTAFAYDDERLPDRATTVTDPGGATHQHEWNALGQLDHLTLRGAQNGGGQQYQYDALGRMSFRSVQSDQASRVIAYSYDAAGRLTGSQHGDQAHRYAVDAAGNRLDGQQAITDNRLDHLDGARHRFDGAGNMIERQAANGDCLTLGFDGANRLVRLTRASERGRTVDATYRYDGLGRRISKTVRHENGTTATTHYGWDGDRLVREESDNQHSTIVYEPGSFVPMLRIDDTQEGPQLSAFVTDAIGTPMQLVAAHGETQWQGQPDDWAAVKNIRGNTAQPIRFQGQWQDEESGLYYNRHRYYDPQQGRYVSQDPIGLRGGTNLYGYVANPTGMVDPLGLNPAAACAIPAVTPVCASAAQWITGVGVAAATAVVATIPGSTSELSRAQEADRLTAAHQATAGARSLPGYGGNCTPDEYDELERQKDEACSRTKNLKMCGETDIDYEKAEIFDACAQARINVARRCFSGGDSGQNNEINNNLRKSMSCTRDYESKGHGNLIFQ
ncbi:RHS repeat-associated core domain-containing protein [Vreelandella sp. GE22]